ncbi:hypothetical protein ACOMHN_056249 [Nucella lapillus]
MATLQGQANSSEISNRIYQNIRSITPNHHPRHSRPMSASTRLSFPGSSRLSAKSLKESQTATQEAYSDFDIIKNRSWSANRVRSSSSHLGKAGWQKSGDTPLHPPGGSASTLIDPRPLLSPVSSPGTASPPVDGKGKQVSTRDLWNLRGSQVERLHQEWAAIEHCRTMKRASEMVQHRLDHMYRLSGSNIPLMARYHVNDTDMRRLREMTETNRILQLDLKRIVKHVVRKDQLEDKYPQTMAPQSSPYWSSSYSGIPATWGSYPESQQDWWSRDSLAKASPSYDASAESQSGIKINWGLGWSDGESCSLSCFSKETLCDEERGRDVKERGEWKESQPAPNTEIETEIERMNRTETESQATSETKQTTTKRTKSAAEIERQVNVEIEKRRAAAVAKTEDSLDRQESERREGHRQNASFEGSDPRPRAHDQHSPRASQRWISRHKEKNTQCQKNKKRTPLSVRLNFQKKGSPVSKKRAIKDIIEYYTISPPPVDPNPIRKKGGKEEEKPERLSKVAGTDVGHRQKNGPSTSRRQGLPWSDVDTWCSASVNKGKASAEALLTPSVTPAAIGPSSLQQQLMVQHIQQLRQPPTSDYSSGQQAAQHGKTQTAEKEKGNRTVQKGCSPGSRLLSQNRITQPATRQKSDQQLHRQSNPERLPLPQAAVDQPAQRKQPSQQAAHLKSTSSPKPVARQGKYQQLSEWQKKRVQEIIQQFSQQPPNKRSGEEQRTAERQREKLHMTSYKRWLERKRRMDGKTCGSQTGTSSVDSLEDTTVSYSSSDTLCCNRSGKAEPFDIDSANKLSSGHATQVTLLEEQKKKEEAAKGEEEEGDSSDSNEDDYIYKILMSQRFKGGDEVNDSNKGETIPRCLTFKKKGFLCYDLASEASQTQWYNKIMEADNIHKLLRKGLKKSFEVSYRKFERQGTGLVRYLSGTHFHTVQVDRSSSLGDCIAVPVMKTFQLDKIPSNKQNPPKTSNKKKAAEKSQSVSSRNNLSKGRKGRLKENESVGDNNSSILDTSVVMRSEKQAAAEKGEVTQTSQSISQGSTDQTSVSRPETQQQPGDGMQSDCGEQERGRKGNVRQTGERSASQVSRRTSGRTSQAQAKDAKGTSAVRKSRAERHSACCNSQKNIIGVSQSKRKDKKPKLPVKHITISGPVAQCLETVAHKTQGSTQSQSPKLTKEQEFQMSHLFEKKIGSVWISHSPSMVRCSKPRPASAVSCSIPGKKQRMCVMMQGHQAVLEVRPSVSTPCLSGPSSKQLCSCPTSAGHSGCEQGKDKPLTSSSCPNTGHQIQKHFQETASAGDVRSTTRGNCYRKPHGRKSAMSCPDVSARKKRLGAHSAPTAPTFYQKVPVRSVGLNQEGRSVSQRSVSAGWQDRCGGIAAPDKRVFSAQPLRGKQAKGRGQQKYQDLTGKYCKDHRMKGSHLHVDLNKMTFWRSQSGSKTTISAPESDLSTECGRPCQVPVSSLPSAFEQQEMFSSSVITVCSSHISKSKSVSTVTAEEQQCVTSIYTATAVSHNTRQPAPILNTKTLDWTQKVSQDETEKRSPVHTEKKSQSLNPQPNFLGEVQTPVCGEDGKLGATGITERQEVAGLRAVITQTWVQERGDMALARLGNLNKKQEQSNRQISARQPHPTLVLHITEADRERGDNSFDMNLARSQQTVSSPRREVLELHLTMPDTQIICQTDSASSLHNCTKNISALDSNDASLAAKEDTGKKETVNSDSHSVSPKDVHVSNSLTGKKEEDSMITDMAPPAQRGPEDTTKSSFSHYVPCMTSIISDGNGQTPCVSAPSDANSQMAKPGSQTEHTPGDHSTGQKGESRARADDEKVTTLTPITSVIVNYVLNWQQDNSGVMPTKLTAHSCRYRMTEDGQHGSSGACRQLMHSSFCPSHVQGRTSRRYSVPPMRRRKATASAGDGPQWKIATSAMPSGKVIEGMMDETSAVLSPTFDTPGSRFTVPNNGAWGCCPPTWVWDRWAAQTSASMHSANREIAAKASRRVNINRTVKKDSPFAAANGDSSMGPPTPGVNSSGYCTERTRKGFLVKRIRKSPAHPPPPAEPVGKLAPTSQAVTLQSAARRYLEVVRPDLVCKTGGRGLTETSEDLDQSLAKCDLETCGLTAQTAVGSNCEIVREVLQENEPVQTEAPGDDAASMKGDPTPPLSTVPSLLTRKLVMSDTRLNSHSATQQDISGLLHKRAKSASLERAYIPVILPYKDYSLLSISQSTLTRRSSKEKVCDKEEQTPTQMLSSGKLDPCESPRTGAKPAVSVPVTSREAGEQQTPRHASKDRRCQSADLGHKDTEKPASSRRVQSADIKGRWAGKSRRPRSKKPASSRRVQSADIKGRWAGISRRPRSKKPASSRRVQSADIKGRWAGKSRRPRSKKRKGNKKVDDESSVEETDKTFLTPSCAASSGGDNPTYQSGPQSICSPQHTNTQSFRQPTVTPAHSKEKTPRGKPACAKRHRKPRAVFSSADCDRGIRDHLSNSLDQRRMSDTTQKEEETVETRAKMDTEKSETDTTGKKYAQSCASSFRDNPTSQLGAQTTRSSQHTTTETSKHTPLPPARSRKKTPAKKHKKPATVFGHADDLEVKDHYMTKSKSKKTLGNPGEKKRTDIKTKKKTVMVDARMNTNNSMFASSGRENPANRPKVHSISHFQCTTTETSKQSRPSSAHSQEKTPRERSVSAKRHNKPETVFGSAGNHSMIRTNVKNPDTPEEKKRTNAMKTQEKTVKGATRMDAKNTKIDSAVKYTQSCAWSGRDSPAVQPKVKTICSSQHTPMQTSKQSPFYPYYSQEKTPKKRAASAKRLEKPATPYGSAEATLGPNDHSMIRNNLKSPDSPQQKKRTDTMKTKEKTVMADTRMDTEIHSAVKRYTQRCALSGGDSPAVQPRTQSICSSHHTTVHISKLYPLSPARGQEKTPRERSASARRHNKPETVFGHADDLDVNNHSILRNKKTPDSPNGKKTINTFGKEAKPAKVDTRMDKDNTETPPRAVKKYTPRWASAGRNNPADQTQVPTICNFQHTSLESPKQSPLSSARSREKTPRERSASAKRHKKPGAVFGCAHDLDVNNHYVLRNKMTPESPDEKKRTETIKTKDKTVLADSRMDTDNTETDFAVKKYTQSHASSGRDNPVVRSGAQTIRSSQHTTTETSKQTPLSSTHSQEKMPRERSASAMKHKKPAAVFGSAEGNMDTRDHSVIRKNLKSHDSLDGKKRTDTIKTKEKTIKGDSRMDTDNTETDTAVKKYTQSHASSGRDNPAVQPKVQTICGSQHTTAETSKQPPLTSAHSREKTPKERAASTKGHKKPAAVFGSARDHSVIRNNFKSPESPDEKKRSGIIKTKEKTIKNDTRLDTGITEIDNPVRKYTYAQSCASPDRDDPANQCETQAIRSSPHTTTESSKQPCLSSACSQEKMPREKAASAKKNKKPVNVFGSAEDHSLIRNHVKTPDEKKTMDTIKRKEKSVEDDTWMDTDNTEIDTAVKKYTQSCAPSGGDSPAVQPRTQSICSSHHTTVHISKLYPLSPARGQEKTPRERSASARRHNKPETVFGHADDLDVNNHSILRNKKTPDSPNGKKTINTFGKEAKPAKVDTRMDKDNTETPPRAVKKYTPRWASAGRNNPTDQTQVPTICNFQHTSLESPKQSPLSSARSREKTPRERSASAKRHKKPGAVFGCPHDLDVNNHYVLRNKMTPESPDEKKRTETIKTKDKTVLADSRMDTDNTETDFAVKKYTQSHASSGRDNPVVRSGAQTIRSSQHTTTETSKQTPMSSTDSQEKMPRERSASAMKHKKPAAVFGSAEGNMDTRDHSVIRKNLKSHDSLDGKKRTDTIKTKEKTIKGDSRMDTDNTETDTAVKKYTQSHASSGRDNPAVQPKVQTICGSQHTTAETSKQPPLTSAHSREKTPKERAASTKGHKKPAAVFSSARDHSVIRNNFKSPESPDEKKRSGIIKTKEKTIKNDTRLDTGITEIDNPVRKYTYAQSYASPDGDDPANQCETQAIRSSPHTTTESSKQPCLSSACSQEKMPREKAASAKKNKKPVNVFGSAEDHSLIRNSVNTLDEKKRMDTIKRKEKSVEDDTWMDTGNTEIDTAVKKYTQSCAPSGGDSPAVQLEIQYICSSQQTAVQASKQSPPSSAREKTPRGKSASAKRHKKPTDAFGSEEGKLGVSDHPASRNKTTSHSLNRKERACSTKSQEKTEKIDPRIVDAHNTETENTGKKCTRQKKKARKRQAAPKKDSFEGRRKLINEYLELCLSPRDPSDKKVTARNCGKGRKMDLRKGDAVILKGWSTDPNLSLRERAQLHTLNNKPVKKDSIQHTAYEPSQGSTKEVSSFRSHLHPLTALGMRQKAMSSKSNLSHEPEIQAGQNLVSKGVFQKDDHFIGQLCHVGQLEGWVPAPMWQPPESDQPKEEGTGFRGKPHPHQGSTHSLESCHIYHSENCLANEDGNKFCPLSDQSDLQSITFSEVLAQYTEARSMGDQDSGWGQFLHRQKVPPPSPTSDVSQQTFESGLWGGCSHHTDRDTHQAGEWSGGFHQGLAAEDDLWQPLDGKSGRRRGKSLLHRGHSAHVNRTGHGHVDDGCFDILKSRSDTTLTSTDKRNPTSPRARNSISMHEKLRHRHLSDSVSCARGNLHPQPGIDQSEMTGSDTISTLDSVGQNGLARFTVSPIRNFNQDGTVACVCCTHMNEHLMGWGLLGRPGELKPAADSVGSEDVDTVRRRLTGIEAGEEGHYHAPAGDIARNKNSFSPGLRLYEDRAGTVYSTASNFIPPLQLSENRDEAFHGTSSDFIPPLDLSESRYDTVRSTASDFIPQLQLPENRAGRNHSTASDSIPRLQLPENRDEATHYTTNDSCSTTAKHTKPCNHTGWQDPTMEMLGEVRDVFDAITQAKHHQGDSASGRCLSARNKAAFCQPPHSHRETGSGGRGTGERETWLSNVMVPCPVNTEQCDRPGTTNPDVFNLIEEGRFDDAEVFKLFPKIRSCYLKTENRPSGSKGKIGQNDTVRYFQRLILEPTFSSRCKDHDHIGHPPSASQPGTPTVTDRAFTEFPSYQPTADDQLKCRSARSVLSSHTISLRRKRPTQSARDRYSGDSVLGTEREVNRAAQSVLVMRPCKSCQPLSASPVTPEHKNRQTKSLLPKETVKKDVYRKQIHQGDMLKHTPSMCTSRFHDINRLGPETLSCAPKRIQDKRRQIINVMRPQSAPSWRLSHPHMSVTGRKYPQGGQSSRREKTHRSKSQGKPESSSSQPAERGEEEAGGTDRGQETRDQIDGLTSPFPQPLPAVGDPPHPTSPVSTPEDTPRVAETEDQEESTRPGEASVTDNSFS